MQATVFAILSATPQPDQRVTATLEPSAGAHATTTELQYRLTGEVEFGHSTPITTNQMTVIPVSFRTRVAKSNPGFVSSLAVTMVVMWDT